MQLWRGFSLPLPNGYKGITSCATPVCGLELLVYETSNPHIPISHAQEGLLRTPAFAITSLHVVSSCSRISTHNVKRSERESGSGRERERERGGERCERESERESAQEIERERARKRASEREADGRDRGEGGLQGVNSLFSFARAFQVHGSF